MKTSLRIVLAWLLCLLAYSLAAPWLVNTLQVSHIHDNTKMLVIGFAVMLSLLVLVLALPRPHCNCGGSR